MFAFGLHETLVAAVVLLLGARRERDLGTIELARGRRVDGLGPQLLAQWVVRVESRESLGGAPPRLLVVGGLMCRLEDAAEAVGLREAVAREGWLCGQE